MGKGRKGTDTLGTDPREPTHRGVDWPTHETSGQAALGRKEAGKRGDWETGAKKEPLGDS